MPINILKAIDKGNVDEPQCNMLLEQVKNNLKNVNYNGLLLKPDDLLLSIDSKGKIVKDTSNNPLVVNCNFKHLWKYPDAMFL